MLSNFKKLQIPSNLDLEQLLLDYPTIDYKGVNTDYLALLCHTLIHLKANRKEHSIKNNGMVKLNASVLHSQFYSYRQCLNYLIDVGVLTTDGSYRPGIDSIGFDFTTAYIGNGFKDYFIQRPQFKRTLTNKEVEIEEKNKVGQRSIRHLFCSFNKEKLNIDHNGTEAWIKKSYSAHLETFAENYLDSNTEDEYIRRIKEKHNLYRLSVNMFKAGIYNCKLDDTGHRFHSSLTNLKSELRNFITYDGKPLVSVDIKNSQPYFSLLLFKRLFYSCSRDKDTSTLKDIHPELYSYFRKTSTWEKLKKYADCKGLVKRYISIERYKQAVLEGTFYEDLAELVKQDTMGKKSLTRSQAKKRALTIFFGDTYTKIKHMDEYKTFRRHYPDVVEIFDLYKSRPAQGSQGVRYQDLSILLQRIESNMVLHVITKKFHRLYPTAPLLTIHDCVVTDIEHKDVLADIITSELRKIIGVPPKLTEEYWTPENVTVKLPEDLLLL